MKQEIQNIKTETLFNLQDLVAYNKDHIAIQSFVYNDRMCYRLMAFKAGQSTGVHTPVGDAVLTSLEGAAHVEVDGKEFTVQAGQSILLPANHPHNVSAKDIDTKVSLIVAFPAKQYVASSNLDQSEYVPPPTYDQPLAPQVKQNELAMNDDSREMIQDGRF